MRLRFLATDRVAELGPGPRLGDGDDLVAKLGRDDERHPEHGAVQGGEGWPAVLVEVHLSILAFVVGWRLADVRVEFVGTSGVRYESCGDEGELVRQVLLVEVERVVEPHDVRSVERGVGPNTVRGEESSLDVGRGAQRVSSQRATRNPTHAHSDLHPRQLTVPRKPIAERKLVPARVGHRIRFESLHGGSIRLAPGRRWVARQQRL